MTDSESPDDETRLGALVAAMAKVGSARSPTFSPDGSRIAFISDLSGVPQVWTIPMRGGWPQPATTLDDPVVEAAWSPTGDSIAFSLAPGGGMNTQIYLVAPDGAQLRRITDGGAVNNWLGPWSRDGRYLAISSNRRDAACMDCYTIDIAGGGAQLLSQNPGISEVTDFSPDDSRVLLKRTLQRSDSDIYLVDRGTREERRLTPHVGPANVDNARFSTEGDAVYLCSNQDREFIALSRVRLDGQGAPHPPEVVAERVDADLEAFEITRDGRKGVLIWNANGQSEVEFVDLSTGKVSIGPALPAEFQWGPKFSPDGSCLALSLTGALAPWDVWLSDTKEGGLHQLTFSPHAGVRLEQLVRPVLVRFRGKDDLPLSGWLYRPQSSSGPGPVVLSFHGGPESQERPFFNEVYQALVQQGIAVFAPNVRGSSGFGRTFTNLDNGPLRVNAVEDIASCLRCIVETRVGHPGQIGIMGGSYGGFMTMAGLTQFPDQFAAGADLFGIVNFETFFSHTEPWMAAMSKIEYGDPDTQREFLRRLSPIHQVGRVTAPTIVLHGANDTNVPVVEAEQVVQSLRERGVPVEYVLFPDEGHGFVKEKNRVRSATAIVEWFSRYLRRDLPGRSNTG